MNVQYSDCAGCLSWFIVPELCFGYLLAWVVLSESGYMLWLVLTGRLISRLSVVFLGGVLLAILVFQTFLRFPLGLFFFLNFPVVFES